MLQLTTTMTRECELNQRFLFPVQTANDLPIPLHAHDNTEWYGMDTTVNTHKTNTLLTSIDAWWQRFKS